MTKPNLLMVSMVMLGLAGAINGCKADAQVSAGAQTPPPPPPPAAPTPPPPPPVASAAPTTPPPPPAPAPPTAVGKAKIEGSHVKIPGELEFDKGKATLKESAGDTKDILTTLVNFMTQNPTVTKLRIEGHTDNSGTPDGNMKLSQDRADAVAAWLSAHGVDKSRLDSKGFGQNNPLCKNDTPAHMKENRATVFAIAELNGQPQPDTAATSTCPAAPVVTGQVAPSGSATPAAAAKH